VKPAAEQGQDKKLINMKYIYFNTRDTFIRIELSQILFFQADKNYTLLQLSSGKRLMFTFTLLQAEKYLREKLGDDSKIFARVGKSFIINLNYVRTIEIVKQKLEIFYPGQQKAFMLSMSKESLKNLRSLFINS
jgi:DNA-binding LytR/AlgR family response regulator